MRDVVLVAPKARIRKAEKLAEQIVAEYLDPEGAFVAEADYEIKAEDLRKVLTLAFLKGVDSCDDTRDLAHRLTKHGAEVMFRIASGIPGAKPAEEFRKAIADATKAGLGRKAR